MGVPVSTFFIAHLNWCMQACDVNLRRKAFGDCLEWVEVVGVRKII